ncbi:LOW QUALITY PROTEIN: pre-mRNA-processing factor 39-like [Rhopalosiphum maidis]|uniref:LOW QUALITY PROTEIN: pre-mRNA-processing factor 39-like n=1 Tax=Rhopalosiphum maidis TaxID=43146 RepID=UPI000F00060D|nr:LOW QUALITY PROTEIN: pre-mRNA-processing factor 39-like [Rhopalosiphum maidis]
MADHDETLLKNEKSKENGKINDSVPELDDTEPPKVIITAPPTMSIKMISNKLQKSSDGFDNNKDSDDCQIILPKTEIIDITDDICDKDETLDETSEIGKTIVKYDINDTQTIMTPKEEHKEPETEVISEDEMPVDNMPVDTEAVSEDELPPTTLADQTEIVSDEELPSENGTSKIKRCQILEEKEDDNESQPAKKVKTEEVKPITELDKFWQAVKDDPSDFAGWTYLLQYVDQENIAENAREAYDKFLELYPYCYGYWRKFADFEKRNNNKEECEVVFQRGLNAIPLSVDLWIHYMTYLKTQHADDVDLIRSKFEKGLEMCGLEYRSDRLWDHYIKWEIEQNKLINAFNIYNRLLATQTLGYLQHFENFKEFVNKNAPDKILNAKEYLELRQQVAERIRLSGNGELLTDDSAPPGEEENTFLSDVSEKELALLKETIIESKQKINKETAKEIAKRQAFEEGIKRPYFHVKPLEKCQIENWKNYILLEKEAGDHQRIVVLYERCLIPCALYEDFWLSYLDYLESLDFDVSDLLKSLYLRACLVHHRKSPELHLKWSAFEESKGNLDKAAEILKNLDDAVPHMLQIIYRRINLEKRRDQFDKVCELYEHYINTSHTKFLTSNIAIKYARFLWKCASKIDKAIELITEIINKDKDNMQDNARLLLQLIELKMSVKPLNEKSVIQIFDEILSMSSVNLEQKILFSQRKLEFIEDYTCDYISLRKATNEFKSYTELLAKEKKKALAAVEEEKSRIEKEMKVKQAQDIAASSNSQTASTNYQPYNTTGYYPQQYATGYNQAAYQQYAPTGQDYSYQYQNWSYPQATNYNQTWGSYNYSGTGSGGSGGY